MGTKEEIEKLRASPVPDDYGGGEDAARIYQLFKDSGDEMIDAVLSILDEHLGELMVEKVVPDHITDWGGSRRLAERLAMTVYDCEPGDHISIYVRKEK